MNLENLKNGFDSILKKGNSSLSETQQNENTQNDNIFACYEEFKEYLIQQTGVNPQDLSANINDIKEMDVIDGQIRGSKNDIGVSTLFIDIINEAIKNEDVIKAYDNNDSGYLTEDEISSFYNTILEDGEEEITFDSLAKGVNALANDDNLNLLYSNLDDNALIEARLTKQDEAQAAKEKLMLTCRNEGDASGIYNNKKAVEVIYKNALNNDSNLDEQTKNSVLNNMEAINSKKNEYYEIKFKIYDDDIKLDKTKYQLNLSEQNISALEQKLSELEQNKEYSQNYEKEKAALEDKLSKANEVKKQAQDYLKQMHQIREEDQKSLEISAGELIALEKETLEINRNIEKNASQETLSAIELYNKSEANFDSLKENMFNSVKEEYQYALDEFQSINTESIKRGLRSNLNVFLNPDDGEKFLEELSRYGGDAPPRIGMLSDVFGFSDEETGAYLTALANSPQWGMGCIEPVVLFAQICQESDFDPSVIDVNNGGQSQGLGQFKQIAVDQVNKVFNTDYSYEDRANPIKSTEMMALLLRYCFGQTGDSYAALAMYNQGGPDGIYTSGGVQYLRDVLKRIGMEYNG